MWNSRKFAAEKWSHLMETPKHLLAIAASKNTAALGNVISAMAKNEARRCGACVEHNERRYRAKAATVPENTQVMTPGINPPEAIA